MQPTYKTVPQPRTLSVRKCPPSIAPHGPNVARHGYVWGVFAVTDDGEVLLGIYATAKEARRAHSIWPPKSEAAREAEKERSRERYKNGRF